MKMSLEWADTPPGLNLLRTGMAHESSGIAQRVLEAAVAMAINAAREYKDLTTDHLFNLLSGLPEDVEADQVLVKRGACRWLLRAPAEFYFKDMAGGDAKEYVSIRDISLTGVGLVCKKPVKTGLDAELILPLEDGYYKVNVKVAHCTQTIGGHKVGCHLLLVDAPVMVPMINRAMLTQEEYEHNGV